MKNKRFTGIPLALIPVIFRLAWPTMLEQFMQTAVQYIDTAMVGSLGTEATAAVGSTSTVNWLVNSTVSAVGVGFLAMISRFCGAGDKDSAARTVSQATLAVLFTGILFTVLPLSLSGMVPVWMNADPAIRKTSSLYFFILYTPMLFRAASSIYGTALRAAGDTRTPMRVAVGVNIINVCLNFLMIYPTREVSLFGLSVTVPGFGWGVIGAAVASAIAYACGGVCITLAVWRHPVVSPKGYSLRPDPTILRPCLKIAFPNMLQRFGTSLGYVVFASMINSLGEISTAAHTIANTVESAFYVPGYGMQTAAATLSGNAYGARDNKQMKELAKVIVLVEVCLMTVSGTLLYLFAPTMMGLFSTESAVILLGTTVLRMVAVSEPFYGISIITEGMMQGVGHTVVPFVFGLCSMWLVRIGGTFVTVRLMGMGLTAAWGCMIAHNMTLFVLLGLHYLRGKWNPLRSGQDVSPA